MGRGEIPNFTQWLEEHRSLVEPLRMPVESGKTDAEIADLVGKCYQHYSNYVNGKIKAAEGEGAYMAAGMWRTPVQAVFLWMGGWRPTSAIVFTYSLMGIQIENEVKQILEGVNLPSMVMLSAKQLTTLNSMQQRSKNAEDSISNRVAALQMLVTDQEMARVTTAEPSPSETNDFSQVRNALEPKLIELRNLLVEAEQLRLQTFRDLLGLFTPLQAAQYAVAAFEMASAVRKLGDRERAMYSRVSLPSLMDKSIWELASQGQTWELAAALQPGTDPSAADPYGRTPLHDAAAKGHIQTVAFLVEQGANVNKKDDSGDTPLGDALKGGHNVTAQFLVNSGADASAQDVGAELSKHPENIRHRLLSGDEAGDAGSDAVLKGLEDDLESRRYDIESQDSASGQSEGSISMSASRDDLHGSCFSEGT